MIDKDGYIRHYLHDHPYRPERVRAFEHVLIMELLIDRPIRDDEVSTTSTATGGTTTRGIWN